MFHVLDFAFNLIDCNNKTFHGEDLTSNPIEKKLWKFPLGIFFDTFHGVDLYRLCVSLGT